MSSRDAAALAANLERVEKMHAQTDREIERGFDITERLAEEALEAIPVESDFLADQVEYIVSGELAILAARLIETKRSLKHLNGVRFAFLWKQKGGQSGGKAVLGKCAKTPPLVQAHSFSTFTIWIAVDHLVMFGMTPRQLEALMFHELCHAVIQEVESEAGDVSYKPVVLKHDVEMFLAEVEEYGLWTTDLSAAQPVFQRALPGLDPAFDPRG